MAIPAGISLKKIEELLVIEWGNIAPPIINTVVLDLNSALNTICRVEGLAEYSVELYINEISHLIRNFIQSNLDKKIIVLYNKEKTYLKEKLGDKYLDFFYDKRPELSNNIIEHFIKILEKIGESTNINVIDTGKFEVALIIYILKNRGNVLIISRNHLVLQTIKDGGYHWDGTFMYSRDTPVEKTYNTKNIGSKLKFPKELPYTMLPYYIFMRGILGHGYPGMNGFGEKRTMDYLRDHISEIVDGNDKTINYDILNWFIPMRTLTEIILKDDKLKVELKSIVDKTRD